MAMNFKEASVQILKCVGGPENIESHTHCMTRLQVQGR